MKQDRSSLVSRRDFLSSSAAIGAGLAIGPSLSSHAAPSLITRPLGKTGLEVTRFGLGGQAILQWPSEKKDPEAEKQCAINLALDKMARSFQDLANSLQTLKDMMDKGGE